MTAKIDWEKVDQWLAAGCNGTQCAAAMGIHYDTLARRCKTDKNKEFAEYLQEKRAHGDSLILAAQFQKAIKEKHPTMLVWLGKQRLHQKESVEQTSLNEKYLTEALKQVNCFEIDELQNKIKELQDKLDGLEHQADTSNTTGQEAL